MNLSFSIFFQEEKTPRCAHPECRVKLKLTGWACKCSKIYCAKHRSPAITDKGGHECSLHQKKIIN